MTLLEKETHAQFCEADEVASIYSTRPGVWKMCEKAGWTLHLSDGGGKEYRGPRSELKIRVRKPVKQRPETVARQAAHLRGLAEARRAGNSL
jgi:hypothetical protein